MRGTRPYPAGKLPGARWFLVRVGARTRDRLGFKAAELRISIGQAVALAVDTAWPPRKSGGRPSPARSRATRRR